MNETSPRHVRSEPAQGPSAAEAPWTDLDPPQPLDDPAPAKRAPSGHRVTQETLDRMAELRRQGATHQDIAARLGCSERTVRRYAGRVERQLVPPPPKIPEDPEAQRAELVDWYTRMLGRSWDRVPSVALIDEAIRQLAKRVRELTPETLRLVTARHEMRLQLFKEAIGPLLRDYSKFLEVVRFLEQFPDHRPLFWSPHGGWIQGDDDEPENP